MKPKDERDVGIDKDAYGGMTETGWIIRGRAFGIIPETETGKGRLAAGRGLSNPSSSRPVP